MSSVPFSDHVQDASLQEKLDSPNTIVDPLAVVMAQNITLEKQLNSCKDELTRLKQIEQDLTQERLKIQVSLLNQQAEHRALLDALPDMMLRVRQDGFCLDFLPPIGESRNKYTPVHFHLSEVLPPDLLQRQLQTIQQAIATRTLQIYEHSFEKQGKLAYEEVRISALNDEEVLIIVRDISDRKFTDVALRQSEAELREKAAQLENLLEELQQTQMQLIQSEKMSSLGQLVAGIAHEINNPVNFIHGNITYADRYAQELAEIICLYQSHYPDPVLLIQQKLVEFDLDFMLEDLFKLFQSMETGVDRIRQIIQALHIFSHLNQTELKAVDLHLGIESALTLLQGRLTQPGFTIQLIKQYGNLPILQCCPGDLNQVFMQLFNNAIDALENYSSNHRDSAWQPTITIQTDYLLAKDHHSLTRSPNPSSPIIQIRIADNGIGMTEAIQQHIFDPFFTTKSVGQGLGMGLPICYQIITQKHQGTIAVHSIPNSGTEFIIQLPT